MNVKNSNFMILARISNRQEGGPRLTSWLFLRLEAKFPKTILTYFTFFDILI